MQLPRRHSHFTETNCQEYFSATISSHIISAAQWGLFYYSILSKHLRWILNHKNRYQNPTKLMRGYHLINNKNTNDKKGFPSVCFVYNSKWVSYQHFYLITACRWELAHCPVHRDFIPTFIRLDLYWNRATKRWAFAFPIPLVRIPSNALFG